MFRLDVLGSPDFSDADGRSIGSVLSQPKRLGVLVYLLLCEGYCRRETLLPLFWPELDEEHARAALRQTLYLLRRSLGTELLVGRGDDEISVAPGSVWCDAVEFRRAVADGRREEAIALYRGDLLPGFYLTDLLEFERWLEHQRTDLREAAAGAADALAVARGETDVQEGIRWARRAASLAPTDEARLRRLLLMMHRADDRTGAARVYQEFARSMREGYELDPSPETQRLIASIRTGEAPAVAAPRPEVEVRAPEVAPGAPALPSESAAGPDAARGDPRPPRRRRGRWLGGVTATAALAAVGVLALSRLPALSGSIPPGQDGSIAVLPIEDLSADSAAAYLGEGMTDELIGLLGKVPEISVASRTSVYAFRGAGLRVREIGERLDVDYVLEGSVQRADDRVRFSVRLVSTRDGRQRWSETYDRPMADVLAIRDEIGAQVVRAVAGRIAPTRTAATAAPSSSAAYDDYLRGKFLVGRQRVGTQSRPEVEQAIRYFTAATEKDRGFARAHAALADAYILWSEHADPRGALPLAREAAQTAVDLDESDAEAHLALANIKLTYEWDWSGAEREYRRALALEPDLPEVYYSYGRFLRASRRFDEALRYTRLGVSLERATAVDTLEFSIRTGERLANALFFSRRYEDAIRAAEGVLELDPGSTAARSTLAAASQLLGRPEAAIRNLQETVRHFGDRSPALWRLADAYARAGRRDDAEAILRLLLGRSRSEYVPKHQIGSIYLGLGRTDEALDWFEEAIAERPGWWVTNFNASPRYEALRANPRFRAMLATMNAPG